MADIFPGGNELVAFLREIKFCIIQYNNDRNDESYPYDHDVYTHTHILYTYIYSYLIDASVYHERKNGLIC